MDIGVGLLGNAFTSFGHNDWWEGWPELRLGRQCFFFLCPFTSFHTLVFSYLLLLLWPYFILAIPIHDYLGKHSCMCYNLHISYSHIDLLSGTCF